MSRSNGAPSKRGSTLFATSSNICLHIGLRRSRMLFRVGVHVFQIVDVVVGHNAAVAALPHQSVTFADPRCFRPFAPSHATQHVFQVVEHLVFCHASVSIATRIY